MIDHTIPFFTEAASYDARRSGSGSVARPYHLGQPFPAPHRRTYARDVAVPVSALAQRVFSAPCPSTSIDHATETHQMDAQRLVSRMPGRMKRRF